MDNNKKESPWEDLADQLDVEVDPSAAERHQPPPADLPSVSQSADPDKLLSAAKPQPSDWSALASSLGLEIPEPSTPPEEKKEPVVDQAPPPDLPPAESDAAKASSEETEPALLDDLPELRSEFDKALVEETPDTEDLDSEEAESGVSGEAARSAFDALFAEATSDWELPSNDASIFDTPLEFSRLSEEETPETEVDSEIAEEQEPERPKRRRSRRRRRGRTGTAGDKSPDSDTVEKTEEDGVGEEVTGEKSEDKSSETEVAKGDKPKRRGSRRRGRRGGSERSGREGDANVPEQAAEAVSDDLDQLEEIDCDVETGENAAGSRQRSGHRNLPTWAEAVTCIVDSNLEQRSKAPSKPTSSRGRGRGRGRRKS